MSLNYVKHEFEWTAFGLINDYECLVYFVATHGGSNHFAFPEGLPETEVEKPADGEQHEQAHNRKADKFLAHQIGKFVPISPLDEGGLDSLNDLIDLLLDPLGLALDHRLVVLLCHHFQIQQLQSPPDLNGQLQRTPLAVPDAEGIEPFVFGQFEQADAFGRLVGLAVHRVQPGRVHFVFDGEFEGARLQGTHLDCVLLAGHLLHATVRMSWQKQRIYSGQSVSCSLRQVAAISKSSSASVFLALHISTKYYIGRLAEESSLRQQCCYFLIISACVCCSRFKAARPLPHFPIYFYKASKLNTIRVKVQYNESERMREEAT